MNPNKETLYIHLLGKPYPVACPPDETYRLKEAAQYLDQKLQKLVMGQPNLSSERVAIMAALELAHEVLTQRVESLEYKDVLESKMRALTAALDTELC